MRKTILTASLAALFGVSSVGCKSMPSLAFWKTAKTDAPATAVAQAPALPSDVALKTEGLAGATTAPSKTVAAPFTSAAPAYSPNAALASTPAIGAPTTGYPSTGIPASYPTTSASAPMVASAPANYPTAASSYQNTAPSYASAPTGAGGSNLGSIAMPYNPNAVPPAPAPVAAPTTPAPSADRYASAPATSFGTPTNVAATAPAANTGSRYGAPTTPAPAPASNATASAPAPGFNPSVPIQNATAPIQNAAAQVNNSMATLASAVGDRYAQAVTIPATVPAPVTTTPATAPIAAKPQAVPPNVATAQPYRPGGTGTYPGAKPEDNQYEVATRPETTPAPTATSAPTQTATPQAPRYW